MFMFPVSISRVPIVFFIATEYQSAALDSISQWNVPCFKPATMTSSRKADSHISLGTLELNGGIELALQLRPTPAM